MDVVTTSLEALIQRVTNPQNQKPDVAATEAFCVMLTKESEGIQIGTKLLAVQIQSSNESEALQALALLDTCMKRCGPSFHGEIGKFRFLNEMIRLVSPKYLGGKTPPAVRQKVLQLLQTWIKEYPREIKIKEAYEMLKKQGVIEEDAPSLIAGTENGMKTGKPKNTIFEDEEKSKLLKKLLQSKNPYYLQTANRLIKAMVLEDEIRVQLNSRRIMDLESVHNNAKLLSEMLDSYDRTSTSTEDLEIIKELHQACERLKPIVLRLAKETQDNEEMLGDVLLASYELSQVLEKYNSVLVRGEPVKTTRKDTSSISPSLLDLSSPLEGISSESDLNTLSTAMSVLDARSNIEMLGDIFGALEKEVDAAALSTSSSSILIPQATIMQPVNALPACKKEESSEGADKKLDSKARALEELNELGETLLKQSLSGKLLGKQSSSASSLKHTSSNAHSVVDNSDTAMLCCATDTILVDDSTNKNEKKSSNDRMNTTDDESLISTSDLSDEAPISDLNVSSKTNTPPNILDNSSSTASEPEIKPLTDLHVNLQDIKPSSTPPMTVIEEKNGISVVLHFAQDNPRPDVSVIVITTMSKNSKPLSNYLFQAVVPKKCKCRLQPPSGTNLPAHNPFLPPSAITQIMLIANPSKEAVSLKFMLSYTMDEETFTEMGDVDKLPRV